MADHAATVIGLAVAQLRRFFTPEQQVPPLGGGTDTVNIVAGEVASPPPWVGVRDDDDTSCDDCGPYLWVRLVRRWRTEEFPTEATAGGCGLQPAITIEAGIARCHPFDPSPADLEEIAMVQLDDSWRIDRALCAAMREAESKGVVANTGLGAGEPFGPEGLVIAWLQTAHAQL